MKKTIALLSSIALASTLVAGCDNDKKDDNFNSHGINIKFMSIIYRSYKR